MLLGAATTAWAANVTVTLTAPANGSTYVNPPASITLSATASATGGYTVSKVEFFRGSTLINGDTTAPYSISWTNVAPGSYALTAKATAIKAGSPIQTATSSVVNIFVNAPPVVTLTSPPAGGTTYNIPPPPSITVSATASDSDGSIRKVEFYDCGLNLLATRTTPPYSFVFTTQPPYWFTPTGGSVSYAGYTFIAFATDNLGAVSMSGGGICAPVFLVPTVTLTNPANGASFTAPATINLTAALGPPDAPVEKMQFYNGTTLIGEALSAPYSFSWQNVPAGTYSLSAKGIWLGGKGHQTSLPVNVTVTAGSAQLYFIHPDHLNTPRMIASATGTTVWRWDQGEPFGNDVPNNNPSGLGAFDFPLRFPGQYFDRETNLAYNYFRDYDPGIGRYLQSDPIGLRGAINTYIYVSADPIAFRDLKGLILECKEVIDGFYNRSERVKFRDDVYGWVTHCSPRWIRSVPGIPNPTEGDQRNGGRGGFPGDLDWGMFCRKDWEVVEPAIWIDIITTMMRHHIHCVDKDKCPPREFNLWQPDVPLDLSGG